MPLRRERGLGLLTDPTRRAIIGLLAVRPSRSTTIATTLGFSRSAASRHLRLLEEAGLVTGRQSMVDGRGVLYAINSWAHGPSRHFLPEQSWALFRGMSGGLRRRRRYFHHCLGARVVGAMLAMMSTGIVSADFAQSATRRHLWGRGPEASAKVVFAMLAIWRNYSATVEGDDCAISQPSRNRGLAIDFPAATSAVGNVPAPRAPGA
jgi:DNA-binding transcriptional ArsR family regulator